LMDLSVSPSLRDNEIYWITNAQLSHEETRETAWQWVRKNMQLLVERMPTWRKGRIVSTGRQFCSAAKKAEIAAFFDPRSEALQGAPRELAKVLENIDLCIAKVDQHQAGFDRFIESQPEPIPDH